MSITSRSERRAQRAASASGREADAGRSARQKTLKSSIQCTGAGLHSGAKVSMTLCPAEPDTGIAFRRTDIAGGGALIPAHWKYVVDTRRGTTVGNGAGVAVATVEHLLAAFAGCEIDNALVEITGPEVPVMDGSAEPFVFLIECAGVVEQDAPRRGIRVLKPMLVRDGASLAALAPGDGLTVHLEIEFDSPAVARQECVFRMVNGGFKSDICRARTFGFLDEVDDLHAAGLAQGGSLDNAVVVSGKTVLNDGGLRYSDEFVRHKVLDAIGDLYLAGGPLVGHFHGVQSGHTLNRRLLAALFADPGAWEPAEVEAAPAAPAEGEWAPASLAASA